MSYSNRRPSLRERASARNTGRSSGSKSTSQSPQEKKILTGKQFSARERTNFGGNIKRGIVIGLVAIVILLVWEYFRS